MKSWQDPREAGVSAPAAFLALGAVAVVAILAIVIATMSGPEDAPPVVVPPGNETVATNTTDVTDVTPAPTPTPAPEPHKLRIVAGKGTGPTPEPSESPDGGMYFDDRADKTPRHIAYAFQSNVSGIAEFTAYWTIPERPKYDGGPKHTIFLWTGIQQGNLGLIQCVLEWDHDNTGKYWTLACWVVNARDQSFEVSRRISAYPGDRVRAELRYVSDLANPGRKVWHLNITDETHECSAELIDSKGAVDTNQDLIVFSGVLEGIGSVSDGDDLPGDVMFGDITYKNEYGQDMPIYLTGSVNDQFGRVAVEYEDGPSGSPVIIRTNYGQ